MRIKMLTGVRGDPSANPGEEVDVANHVALRYIESGQAIEVKVKKTRKRKTQKATRSMKDVERAVLHED